LLTAQPFDPAESPRELHHTQSPGKQQIPLRGLFATIQFRPLKNCRFTLTKL